MLFDALLYLAKKKWELFGGIEYGLTFLFLRATYWEKWFQTPKRRISSRPLRGILPCFSCAVIIQSSHYCFQATASCSQSLKKWKLIEEVRNVLFTLLSLLFSIEMFQLLRLTSKVIELNVSQTSSCPVMGGISRRKTSFVRFSSWSDVCCPSKLISDQPCTKLWRLSLTTAVASRSVKPDLQLWKTTLLHIDEYKFHIYLFPSKPAAVKNVCWKSPTKTVP